MAKFKGLCWTLLLVSSVSSGVAGCNPPADYALVGSAFVPAAHGDIRIEKVDRGQRLIVVQMDHLPPPAEIEPKLGFYVVWFSEVGENPVPQTTLDYEPKTRVGRASIPTALRELDVQITAEQTESPSQPSDLIVAAQKIREK